MADGEYYILKCPYCDSDITEFLEEPYTYNTCPYCGKDNNIYSVFGYNMWLAENNKAEKVNKKPIKDVIDTRARQQSEIDFEYEDEMYDFDEEKIANDYINQSVLMQKRPEAIHELLSFNADVCTMQYRYLIRMGFTRNEAIEIIKKLIEQDFIL